MAESVTSENSFGNLHMQTVSGGRSKLSKKVHSIFIRKQLGVGPSASTTQYYRGNLVNGPELEV